MKIATGTDHAPAATTRAMLAVASLATWLSAAATPAAADPPAPVLRVAEISGTGSFTMPEDPTAALWDRVTEQVIELSLAPPFHQSIALLQERRRELQPPLPLRVSVLQDTQRLYFRLRWIDTTKDDRRQAGSWADAAAIQLPADEEPTSPVMGLAERPVAIWRWNAAAANQAEMLLARGPGTLSPTPIGQLRGWGVHGNHGGRSSEWTVVISQELDAEGSGWSPLRRRKSVPVAFAVWQGNNQQRGGYKLVSGWIQVEPDRGP